jgi:hypothetical protein
MLEDRAPIAVFAVADAAREESREAATIFAFLARRTLVSKDTP